MIIRAFKRLIIIALLLLSAMGSYAQYSVNISSGTTIIDGCEHPSGYIYDDGGPSGQYSNSFAGYIIIEAQSSITISGSYNTESSYDRLYIYDSYGESGTALVNGVSGQGTINTTATSGFVTIKFTSDGSVTRSGFDLQYSTTGASSCTNKPSNITLTNVTTSSATFGWQAPSTAGPFKVRIGSTTATTSTNSYTFNGLATGTIYDFEVSSATDDLTPCCTQKKRFRTVCTTLHESDLPYLYGFEDQLTIDYTASIADCWTTISSSAGSMYPYNDLNHTGNRCMMVNHSTSNQASYIILPDYADGVENTMLSFWLANMSTDNSARVTVGVMDDPFDESTFTAITTCTSLANGEYVQYHVLLSGYQGTGHYVAMRIAGSGINERIDDIKLSLPPTCPPVTNLHVASIAESGVAVAWDDDEIGAETPSSYEVSMTPIGDTTTTFTTTDNYCFITNLDISHTYSIVVKPICQSGDGESDTITVHTSSSCNQRSQFSGSGSQNYPGVPVNSSWGNSCCQTIYTAAQLQSMGLSAGNISKISYTWTTSPMSKVLHILIGSTSQSSFTTSTAINPSDLTLVYSGNHNVGTTGMVVYEFNTPFYWDGTSNLCVMVIMNQPPESSHSTTGFNAFSMNTSRVCSIYTNRDGQAYPTNYTINTGTTSTYAPNIMFFLCRTNNTCPAPLVVIDEIDETNATIRWCPIGNETSWRIRYRKTRDNSWTTAATNWTDTSYFFQNLDRGTEYIFCVAPACYPSLLDASVTGTTICRQVKPFPYDDLYSESVVCRTGNFTNPDLIEGIVDVGSGSINSRHTVHYNTGETDPRTGNLLYTVPEGYCSSVRLGNWGTGSQAESITYTVNIDTTDYDLMLLKYAAVLEDPNHTAAEQPRFTFGITDTNGNDVSTCYNADFVSNANLGWNTASGNVLWKDWTTVGVDLSPLHGQTINIKLTTYDCSQSGHYGYAYFVIDLNNKAIRSNSCVAEENTFYAPKGFSYRWYSGTNTQTTLSTADTLHVSNAGQYYCDLSFVGAPNDAAHANCFFTLSAIAGVRHPYARFDIQQLDTATCRLNWYRLINQSIITSDEDHNDSIANSCESYLWIFDDGSTSSEVNPRHGFTPGNHTVSLVSMLAGGQCTDTATQSVFVASPCMRLDTLSASICRGQSITVFDSVLTVPGTYQLDSIYDNDSLLVRTVFLSERMPSIDSSAAEACNSYLWTATNQTYLTTGIYCDTLVNHEGCDSINVLDLTIYPEYDIEVSDTICMGQTVTFCENSYAQSGDYTTALTTSSTLQCDSIMTLHLHVNDTSISDTSAVACDNFIWHGRSYSASANDTLLRQYSNIHGCDSSVALHLTVNYSSSATYNDTCIENQLPRTYLDITATNDTLGATTTITNASGCDSTVTYNLHVWHNVASTVDTTICDTELPTFSWNGLSSHLSPIADGTSGAKPTQVDTLQVLLSTTHGADSLATLVVHVNPSYRIDVYDTICNGVLYPFNSHTYTLSGAYTDTLSTLSTPACDSIMTLHLHVKDTVMVDTMIDACDQITWFGTQYTTSGDHLHIRYHTMPNECDTATLIHLTIRHSTFGDTTAVGCDSISWRGAVFDAGTDTIPTHLLTNSVGCDSVLRLNMTIYPSYDIHLHDTIYPGDTSFFEDTIYTLPGDYVHTHSSIQGCDSVCTLHLLQRQLTTITKHDTICEGGTYLFCGSVLDTSGVYSDTSRAIYPAADTIVTLILSVVPYPEVSITSSHICNNDPHYLLEGHTDMPWHQWHTQPNGGYQSNALDIKVNPQQTTTYILTADYRGVPLCPASDTITVEPLDLVTARMNIFPSHLSFDNRMLNATNTSIGHVTSKRWYIWYNDQTPYLIDTNHSFDVTVPMYVDSLRLILQVSNAMCADTDTVQVPILRSSLFFPNIFTPNLETNNVFRGVGNGILDFEIWIYDRRGDLMFHSTDINEGWDGTHNGHACPQGNYVYKCRFVDMITPNGWQTTKGSVIIVR